MLSTQSATHLGYFLKCVVKCFKELSPLALVEQRWSQVALQLALSCSSRHYAGRSFQILRALRIRQSTQMLSDILSRLVETVAEQGEDMQGYVTEMMLTLEASIDNLDLEFRPIDFIRDLFMSTPNLAKDHGEPRRSAITAPRHVHTQHARSTSYSVSAYTQRAYAGGGDGRIRSATEAECRKSNLGRSQSAQSLKNLDQSGTEDKLTLVTQMFWITVSLLESDYEYEFSLAVRLLDKILCHLQPERPECREKLDKILQQIKWPNFPGVYMLLSKGCTSHFASESTWSLLSKLILCISSPIIDPTGHLGFPMVTIALLPYLVQQYESPGQVCREAADRVAQMCSHQGDRLTNLATVMSLYSRGTFGKDSCQWTKCVVKYLLDVYAYCAISMVTLLVEVLEKGQPAYQSSCLQILYCMVHYLDVSSTPSSVLNQELFLSITKHVQGGNWREALKILKLAVTRSSTLAAPPSSSSSSNAPNELSLFSHSAHTPFTHTSFAEAESLTKFNKELPGRTLDFTVDLSKMPIIGCKFITPDTFKYNVVEDKERLASSSGSAVSLSRKPSNNQDLDSVWRRPQASQARTRERLVNLLTCFGQRVGLPKSPSVIFSQSSDTLDHQQSGGGSSGEETSLPEASSNDTLLGNESSGNELVVTFKRFDFLDNELEESESDDYFSGLGDHRHSFMEPPSGDSPGHRNFGSVPDLISGNSKVPDSPRESATEDPSTDEESEGSDHEHSHATATSDTGTSLSIKVNNSRQIRSRSFTGSIQSLNSDVPSESDTIDLNSSQASPAFSHLSAVLLNLQADELEETWKAHVSDVMAQSSISHMAKTCQLFPRLFRELRKRLTIMTKEACYYITKTDHLKSVASKILQVLDLVNQHLACPFFYTDSDSLLGSRLVERHRFCVLEIQECFETYSIRKDQAEQSLEGLKSSIKQQSLGDGGSYTVCQEEQKGELCQSLYKVIFKLVLLFESYLKLLEIYRPVTGSPQVLDKSNQVLSMHQELVLALHELDKGQASPFSVDTDQVGGKQEAVTALAEYLHGGRYLRAVQILRGFRSMWPNDVFGMTVEDDVTSLLNVYCCSFAEKKQGVFALTPTNPDLSSLFSQLMEISVKLNSNAQNTSSGHCTPRASGASTPSSPTHAPLATTPTTVSAGGGGSPGLSMSSIIVTASSSSSSLASPRISGYSNSSGGGELLGGDGPGSDGSVNNTSRGSSGDVGGACGGDAGGSGSGGGGGGGVDGDGAGDSGDEQDHREVLFTTTSDSSIL